MQLSLVIIGFFLFDNVILTLLILFRVELGGASRHIP